jgi:hypothetical protein
LKNCDILGSFGFNSPQTRRLLALELGSFGFALRSGSFGFSVRTPPPIVAHATSPATELANARVACLCS